MKPVQPQRPAPRSLLLLPLLGALACNGAAPSERRTVGAETIVLGLTGPLERSAVEFQHDRHTRALQGSCEACHRRDARGALSTRLGRVDDQGGRAGLMRLYHGRCIGCHTERVRRGVASGPLTCGECHVQRETPRTDRRAAAFSYALHGAHVRAAGERCQACHHVKNPQTGRLEYRKGAEDSCRACHHREARGERRSLRQAAHSACIGCHLLPSQGTAKRGPVTCAGCHGARREPSASGVTSRLMRGQPDRLAIRASSKVGSVLFDHRGHEAHALFCTTCHHASLQRCSSCHTRAPGATGGGVSRAVAYHSAASTRSCVGCHEQATRAKGCVGCHQTLAAPPTPRSCGSCHLTSAALASRPTTSTSQPTPLAALPPASAELPAQVTIASLAVEYAPSVLPHRRIVAHLDGAARRSRLASHFHGDTQTLCAACHHHSPVGARPPACGSCHGTAADPTRDRPGLKAAYHRQCIGCHQQMGIRATGCTSCHARREERR